jgi:hypothetical protein
MKWLVHVHLRCQPQDAVQISVAVAVAEQLKDYTVIFFFFSFTAEPIITNFVLPSPRHVTLLCLQYEALLVMLALLQAHTVTFFTVVCSTVARCSVLLRQSFCRFLRVMGLFTKEFMEEVTAGDGKLFWLQADSIVYGYCNTGSL